MELALVVVLCTDLPASEFPTFVESIDGIQRAEDGLEMDVYHTVLVSLVKLHMLNWTELFNVSE
jgi:hypothetical protein